MKGLYLTTLLICMAIVVNAQDSNAIKIHPLNKQEINKRKANPFSLISKELNLDTLSFIFNNRISVPIIKPPIKEIAPEPNLPFREDNLYHMKIIDYINCYGPEERFFETKDIHLIKEDPELPYKTKLN